MPRKKIVPKEEPLKKNIEDILGNTTSDDNNTIIKLPLTDSFLRENDDKKIDPVGYNSTNIDNFTEEVDFVVKPQGRLDLIEIFTNSDTNCETSLHRGEHVMLYWRRKYMT